MPTRMKTIAMIVALTACFGTTVKAQTSKPADALQADTTWTGNEAGDSRVNNRRGNITVYATVSVLKRDGENITFEYWIFSGGVRHGLEMRGQIRDGEIRAQATKVLPGGVWEDTILDTIWTGGLKEQTLILQRTLKTNQVVTATLTLDENPTGRRGNRRGAGGRRGA